MPRNKTIISRSPYPGGLTKYLVSFEQGDGYVETQEYACREDEHEAVLARALEEFCAARAARVSFVDSMYA